MHTYVYCGTVYNSKDLEPTQIPINDRLDKENVAHIHHGILCSHKKDEFLSFVETWMDLETIIFSKLTQEQKIKHHVSTHSQVLNNENTWTQGGEHHTLGSVVGARGGTAWGGEVGRDNMGMPDIDDGGRVGDGGSKPHCHVCTYATILHDLHMYPRT